MHRLNEQKARKFNKTLTKQQAIMKKLMTLFCVALMSVGAFAQEYYEEEEMGAQAGDWAVGLNLDMGFGDSYVNFGITPKIQYYVTDAFRPEISFDYFIEKKHLSVWDININFHYLIHMKYGIYVYPILGATFQHTHETYDLPVVDATTGLPTGKTEKSTDNTGRFGLNAGAGVQYDITPQLYANLELKYQYVKDFGRGIFQIGIGYRF